MVTNTRNDGGAAVASPRHLPHAPITEALIDFRVQPRDGFSFEDLKSAFDTTDPGYYVKNSITEGTFEFKLPPGGEPPETAAESALTGLRLHSSDERYVAQYTISGFTLSRLEPYENWGALRTEAQRLWRIYVERCRPKRVRRVATRFINNLRLPLGSGESIQIYLHKFVDVPEDAPQLVEGFFQRFQLLDASSGARVLLTVALDSKTRGTPVPVILDVDASMETDADPMEPALWDRLDRLRDLKNRCFFGAITERAAELYA